jgi:hypothetical protein
MTRDHEYTDWPMVDRIADDLASRIRRTELLAADDRKVLSPAS